MLDAVLNVVLFIPFGVGLRLAGISRRRAFAIGLVTTITVELLQLYIPGRDTSLGDIFTNSFGCFVGVLCADIWRVVLVPTRRAAARLAIGWTVLWVFVLAMSAELTHVSLTRSTMWGVWRPEELHHDYFPGKVLSATAAGLSYPGGMNGASDDVRRRFTTDSVVVEGTVVGAALSGTYSSVANIYDHQKQQLFMLGQRRGNLIFTLRMQTADFRVKNPTIRLDSVFPRQRPVKLDTIFVSGGLVHKALWIRAEDRGVVRERTLPMDAGLGWSYFLPFDYEYGPEAPWLTGLWLAGLSAPALAWATRAGRRACFTTLVALAAALLLIPFAAGAHATAWWEWFGLAAGAYAGVAIGAATARARAPE